MNAHPRIRKPALATAVGLGVLGDALLRVPGPPGLNAVLWSAAGAAAVLALAHRRGWAPSRESIVLLSVAVLFMGGLAWRDAEALHALNVLAAAVAVSLAAGEAGAAWVRHAGVSTYLKAGAMTAFSLAAGPLPFPLGARDPEPKRTATALAWRRHGFAVLRGAVLAVPPLLVFGGLLMAADPVFARVVSNTLHVDLAHAVEHIVLIGFFAWVSAGYMHGFLLRTPFAPAPVSLPQPRLGITDGAVALGLLNALFLAFVVIQLRYLFGGVSMVEVTPGLSYADYARRGFFELVAVSALVIPLLLLADWAVHRERALDERVFRLSALVQLILLFAIIGSAVYRMRLYQEAYGLTELRLYTTVFMGWVAVVLAWLGVTVLRGRRHRFAFGALVAALVAAAGLNIANPHALIVRVNAERAAAGLPYDVAYAGVMSGDATPALLAALPRLPFGDRCRLAQHLVEEWLPARSGGWRTWNYGDWRARRAVAHAAGQLRDGCPTGTSALPVRSDPQPGSALRADQARTPAPVSR
jgi:hypothetical protein